MAHNPPFNGWLCVAGQRLLTFLINEARSSCTSYLVVACHTCGMSHFIDCHKCACLTLERPIFLSFSLSSRYYCCNFVLKSNKCADFAFFCTHAQTRFLTFRPVVAFFQVGVRWY